MKRILITGSAGFIGAALVRRLLTDGGDPVSIVGLDNLNDYYDPSLKEYRLSLIADLIRDLDADPHRGPQDPHRGLDPRSPDPHRGPLSPHRGLDPRSQYCFVKGDIADKELINRLFDEHHFDIVVNLAAQAGVRYSIQNPDAYIQSNIIGFYNILEACRHSMPSSRPSSNLIADSIRDLPYQGVQHLIYASSSSVYGGNTKIPFSVEDRVDNPVSLYAATKKSNELFAHCYSKLYGIPTTGLRFFTVYGPAGRPDMAYFGFTDKLLRGETIQIFNYGNCRRDFTYIDDIIEALVRIIAKPHIHTWPDGPHAGLDPASPPYAIYNIGGGRPENLLDFVQTLQEELVRAGILPPDYDFEAHRQLVPMQPGDVPITYADASALERDYGFTPRVPLREGLRHFAEWYKDYYSSSRA